MYELKVVLNIAKEAGKRIKKRSKESFNVKEKGTPFDLVTEVDHQSEAYIRSEISRLYPTHSIVGEEFSSDEEIAVVLNGDKDEYIWIIDPIDGTKNFVHNLPGYTVVLSLIHKQEVILGIIYDPNLDELFWAEKGKGAFLNGNKIRVSETEELRSSLIATGFPPCIKARARILTDINSLGKKCNGIRSIGSAALQLAYVAVGRVQGYWEYNLNSWDVTAGSLLVKEAGGSVTNDSGSPYNLLTRDIVVTNRLIHLEFIQTLNNTN